MFKKYLYTFIGVGIYAAAAASVSTGSLLIWLGHPKVPKSLLK